MDVDMSERAKTRTDGAVRIGLLAVAFTIVVSVPSHFLASRYASRSIVADQQLAIAERRPFVEPDGRAGDVPEFRNRILVPFLLKAATQVTPLSPVTAYFGIRVLSAFVMFAVVGAYVARTVAPSAVLPALGVLATMLIVSFNHPYEFPSDYPDAVLATLFVAAARNRAPSLALATAVLGTGLRESAAFGGIVWWCCAPDRRGRRAAVSVILIGAAMAVTTALRYAFRLSGGSVFNSIAIAGSARMVMQTFVNDPGPRLWLIGLIVMAILLREWLAVARQWGSIDWQLLGAAAAILVITLVFGAIHELRVYIPVATYALLAVRQTGGPEGPRAAG
jgi:hypothetical protein